MSSKASRRRGIILAGGLGTRLYPLTRVISKQLLPVYDKPMIYYPLSTLMLAGIREVLLISTPHDLPRFRDLLGDGSQWGLRPRLRRAAEARGAGPGVPHRPRLRRRPALGAGARRQHLLRPRLPRDAPAGPPPSTEGATVFGYHVHDPERYGVVEFDADRQGRQHRGEAEASRSRTTPSPASTSTTTQVVDIAANLKPSPRGELEITDVEPRLPPPRPAPRRGHGPRHRLARHRHPRVARSRRRTSSRSIEQRQGLKVACVEEIACRMGFIDAAQVAALAAEPEERVRPVPRRPRWSASRTL